MRTVQVPRMQTPTVGRFVHLQVLDSADQSAAPVLKARTAVVSDVNADGSVELTVFPPKAAPYSASNVPGAENPTAGSWNWPPRS